MIDVILACATRCSSVPCARFVLANVRIGFLAVALDGEWAGRELIMVHEL